MEKKKSIIITLSLAGAAIILLLCFAIFELKQYGIISSKESNELMKKFNEYFNSEERMIIYYSSSNCVHCEQQTPILETVAEDYDLDYLQIDSSLLSVKHKNKILENLDMEHATPTTIIVENGEVIAKKVGATEGHTFVKFLIENEMLPEDAKYSKEKYLNYVSYEEYEELIESKDTHIIVVGQTSCGHCIAIKPALNSVGEDYNLTINYLNLTELEEEESDLFFDSLKEIEYNDPDFIEDGSFGTPLTLIVKDGKVDYYISGSKTISQLVREFTKAGIIE